MDDIGFLKLIGPYMLGRVKFNKVVESCGGKRIVISCLLNRVVGYPIKNIVI